MSDTVTCPHCNIQYTLEEYGSHWCYGCGLAPSNICPTEKKPDTFCHIHTTLKEYENCPLCSAKYKILSTNYTDNYEVMKELNKAISKFPPFHSAHEGYAILYEEVCELWEVVREKQSTPGREDRLKKECIQVAAMAMRFLHDMKGFKN